MIIKDILVQLEASNHPIAKPIHRGNNFKVLAIGFKSGMKLNDHKAHMISKLTVISGKVIYRQEESTFVLEKYDEMNIPVSIVHSVEAIEDSICLLTQG